MQGSYYCFEYEITPEGGQYGNFQFEVIKRRITLKADEKKDRDLFRGLEIPKQLIEDNPGGLIRLISYVKLS